MIDLRTHHVLGNYKQEIVVFGLPSSIRMLATTTLIHADETFTCVVKPFTQLYIFHGLVKNQVSFPLLYCLVKGKDQAIYKRLLSLVEDIAHEHGVRILDRPVRLMVDFELAFINAARQYEARRNISCCFFHFVANIKKRARAAVEQIKKAVGKSSHEYLLAEKTKRALMMIPLLPLDLITIEVVDMIIMMWKSFPRGEGSGVDKRKKAFDELGNRLVNKYVRPGSTFERSSWCVCGRSIRTNNAAESSHAALNASVRVSGEVYLDMFLFSNEGQLANTRREIEMGCPSYSKPFYGERNSLLAEELSDLFLGKQGILTFLDNCSDVMKIKNRAQMANHRAKKSGLIVPLYEKQLIERNHPLVINAALNLFHSIIPATFVSVQEILTTVE